MKKSVLIVVLFVLVVLGLGGCCGHYGYTDDVYYRPSSCERGYYYDGDYCRPSRDQYRVKVVYPNRKYRATHRSYWGHRY